MKHTEWNTIRREIALWHGDSRFADFMHHLISTMKPSRFVETGTHLGWTCGWVAENFPELPVRSVEKRDEFFQMASENMAEYPSVSLEKGDSRDFIRRQCDELRSLPGVPLFWLDAHWNDSPLRDECRAVASLERYVCVIDDFECLNPLFGGDIFDEPQGRVTNNIQYVSDILGRRYWRPDYEPQTGFKGYGLFLKGVDYQPPAMLREETI